MYHHANFAVRKTFYIVKHSNGECAIFSSHQFQMHLREQVILKNFMRMIVGNVIPVQPVVH